MEYLLGIAQQDMSGSAPTGIPFHTMLPAKFSVWSPEMRHRE